MTITKITAKTHDVGGILIARLLPNRAHRTIGAWCFLDHAGSAYFAEQEDGMQVGARRVGKIRPRRHRPNPA